MPVVQVGEVCRREINIRSAAKIAIDRASFTPARAPCRFAVRIGWQQIHAVAKMQGRRRGCRQVEQIGASIAEGPIRVQIGIGQQADQHVRIAGTTVASRSRGRVDP